MELAGNSSTPLQSASDQAEGSTLRVRHRDGNLQSKICLQSSGLSESEKGGSEALDPQKTEFWEHGVEGRRLDGSQVDSHAWERGAGL